MVNLQSLVNCVKRAREAREERNFNQSFELILTLKDLDVKKGEASINEVVFLPHRFTKLPKVCVFASGDLALRAQKANVDRVVSSDELDRFASDKRSAKKLAKDFDFFLAETALMAKIGKVLGPQLGPRGKMPMPVPPNAPIEAMIERFRGATRVRARHQLSLSCKIGDEAMKDEQVAENALAVLNAVEKKLPMGTRNLKDIIIKLTMSPPVKLASVV